VLEHISEEALQKYQERSLTPVEVLQVCDHLESCSQCREKLVGLHQPDSLFNSFLSEFQTAAYEPTPHLLPEEVIAYVDSQLDDVDHETLDSHLMYCSPCNADIQDLRLFKASLLRPPLQTQPSEKKSDFWGKTLLFWRQSAWGLTLQATALATLVFFLITTLILRGRVADLNGRLGELQEANNALQQELETIPELQSQLAQLERNQSGTYNDALDTEPLNDNQSQIAIRQGALTGLAALSPQNKQLIEETLHQQRVSTRTLPEELIPTKDEQLMAAEEMTDFFPLVYPRDIIIESGRPTLRWGALAGATSYNLTVYDEASKPVAKSPPLTTTSWRLPKALRRGGIYTWEVIAIRDSKEVLAPAPPVRPARFKVLEQSRSDELKRVRRDYNSHLLLGTLYAQAGLFDEAEREFKALLKANPKSTLAQKLLQSARPPKPKKR
jgi:tetratricopeptide (TPR) repeat protein